MPINLSAVDNDFLVYYKKSVCMMPEIELISGARKMPELMRGLKQGKPNIEQLRERIFAKLLLKSVPPPVLEIVRAATLADGLVVVLSERALTHGLVALIERFGRVPVLASMLLDERDSVRKTAIGEAAKPDRTEFKTKDGETFKKKFKPLIDVLRPVLEDIPYEAPSTLVSPRIVAPPGISKELLEREILSSSIYKKLLRQRNELEEKNNLLLAKAAKAEKELSSNQNLISDLRNNVRQNEKECELRIAEGIADGVNNRMSIWLSRSEVLTHSNPPTLDPIARASGIVLEQSKLDKRFGTRSSINDKIQEARRLQGSLRTALYESIRPLPNLADEIKALANYVHDLELLLSSSSLMPTAPRLVQLNEEIQTIDDMDSLIRKKAAVESEMSLDVWSSFLCKQAYELIDRRAMSIYMSSDSKISECKREFPPVTPTQHFEFCIRTAKPSRLMIDGHNLLPKIKPWIDKSCFTEGQGPNALGRALLIEKMRQLTSLHPLISADIWFDGPDDQHWTEANNLRVWFSGGKGIDRADGRILESLQAQSYMESKSVCFVVTEDRDLLKKSNALGAVGISPLEFWTLAAR